MQLKVGGGESAMLVSFRMECGNGSSTAIGIPGIQSRQMSPTVEERYKVNGASEECSGAPVDGAGGV